MNDPRQLEEMVARLPVSRPPPLQGSKEPRARVQRALRLRSTLAASFGGVAAGGATSIPGGAAGRTDPLLSLTRRISYGFQPAEYERARALGYQAYLEEQLEPDGLDDSPLEGRLENYTGLSMSPRELFRSFADNPARPHSELKMAALARAVESKRQLREKMVEFWNDHFSIWHGKDLEWMLLPEFDRTVIRANALGSFPAMLRASATSGAMLYYLDNWLNVRGAAQENYAREVMELHTLGVDGGYSEADVREVAKCFTGWTLELDDRSPDWMKGTFDSRLHQPGKKFALGHVFSDSHAARPEEGARSTELHQVLDVLVAHPSTARFLASKLIRWFLTPTPPEALVDRVAQAYLDTHGDVKAMLRIVLAKENLRFTSDVPTAKFQRPFHYMAGLMRALDAHIKIARPGMIIGQDILPHLVEMGHVPFERMSPDGYPDSPSDWGTTLMPRWIFAADLVKRFIGNGPMWEVSTAQPEELLARLEFVHDPADRRGLAQRMDRQVLGSRLTPFEIQLLQKFIDDYPMPFDETALYDALFLGASLNGAQWY